MTIKKYYLYPLTSLALLATQVNAEQLANAPTLEGGITASIGTFYATPSADPHNFAYAQNGVEVNEIEVDPDYDFGLQASLGYVFPKTANSIELFYRGLDTNDSNTTTGNIGLLPPDGGTEYDTAELKLGYNYNAVDLMIGQYLDLGQYVQMRFLGGLAYVDLKQTQTVSLLFADINDELKDKSKYNGLGPRIGLDARYDFGQGFGIVGAGSFAYFIGDMDSTTKLYGTDELRAQATNDIDNHAVTNLRANLGIDYVYFFDNDDRSTLGLELGYMADYYRDGVAEINTAGNNTDISSVTFSGPYLLAKGVF